MTNEEVIKKIKEICNSYVAENACPFFDTEHDDCIFYINGLSNPFEWESKEDIPCKVVEQEG